MIYQLCIGKILDNIVLIKDAFGELCLFGEWNLMEGKDLHSVQIHFTQHTCRNLFFYL